MCRAFVIAGILGFGVITTAAGRDNRIIDGRLARTFAETAPGERVTAWVYFTAKSGLAKTGRPEALVSPRSLERRRNVLPLSQMVDQTDLPVDQRYVDALSNAGILVRERSKWLNAASVSATPAQLEAIASFPFVRRIEPLFRAARREADREPPGESVPPSPPPAGKQAASRLSYGGSLAQVNSINAVPVHDMGNGAEGIIVGVFDNGFRLPNHETFSQMTIIATYDFVDRKTSVVPLHPGLGFGEHGVQTLSTIGGYTPGTLIGPAYGASYILCRTENDSSETPFEEDKWIAAIEWADSIGVQVTSTSLGYLTYDAPYTSWTWEDMDGRTTAISRAAAMAVRKGIVVVNSAGNEGTGPNFPNQNTLVAPADADSVIAVGALNTSGKRASFSSVGPSTSIPPRIKPDVMAQGTNIVAASPYDPKSYSSALGGVQGTSFACPLAAGAAALILKAVPTATPMQIVNAMRSTASQAQAPDNAYGWGAVNTAAALITLGVDVPSDAPIPASLQLAQNYPNPFNPKTRIEVAMPADGDLRLVVYDLLGREVARLADGRHNAGLHRFDFDGTGLASGVYLYRATAAGTQAVKRMLLIR